MNSKSLFLSVALPLLLSATGALCQTIQTLDPALNQIVPPGAQLEKIATGFQKWTEGPVWTRSGTLLFAEIPANNIDQWIPGKGSSVFLHPSGYKGTTAYGGPEPGSNGMTLDRKGRVTVAGHAQRNVWRMESLSPHAKITFLADTYDGKQLSSPNDLVYKSDGSLYFTDPPYGLPTQGDDDPAKQLKVNGVYRLAGALDQKPGSSPDHAKLQLLISDLPRPNGIAFSPDEKTLYVNNSGPKKFWMRYTVQPDGSVTDGKLIADVTSDHTPGGPDGMKVDKSGNLYSTGPGGIWIFSPAGVHLGTINVPEVAGNLAWGDKDGKTLYITASTSIYRIKLNIEGIRP